MLYDLDCMLSLRYRLLTSRTLFEHALHPPRFTNATPDHIRLPCTSPCSLPRPPALLHLRAFNHVSRTTIIQLYFAMRVGHLISYRK